VFQKSLDVSTFPSSSLINYVAKSLEIEHMFE